jgi:hypothetical protein
MVKSSPAVPRIVRVGSTVTVDATPENGPQPKVEPTKSGGNLTTGWGFWLAAGNVSVIALNHIRWSLRGGGVRHRRVRGAIRLTRFLVTVILPKPERLAMRMAAALPLVTEGDFQPWFRRNWRPSQVEAPAVVEVHQQFTIRQPIADLKKRNVRLSSSYNAEGDRW